MADKRTTPEVPQNEPEDAGQDASRDANLGARRKKRAAPTIDLTASEVPPAAEAEPPSPAAESPPAAPPPSRLGAHVNTTTYLAGAAGAVAMTLILGALWLTGLLPVRYERAAASDSKAIGGLSERIGKIEETLAKLPKADAGMADRLAAAENAMKSLGIALTALNHRADELQANVQSIAKTNPGGVSPAELDALQKRIAELEQSTKAARDDIAKSATADTAARLALSAVALRDAVISGAPFMAELAQARALGANEKDLVPLAPFATSGVPSAQTLAQELRALLPAMLKISGAQSPPGGFLERLEANAGKLVRIRPVDAPPGDDASSVLARIEIDAAKADIPATLADLSKLNDATRAPAQSWIAKAQAREAALADARRFAAETARTLGSKAGMP